MADLYAIKHYIGKFPHGDVGEEEAEILFSDIGVAVNSRKLYTVSAERYAQFGKNLNKNQIGGQNRLLTKGLNLPQHAFDAVKAAVDAMHEQEAAANRYRDKFTQARQILKPFLRIPAIPLRAEHTDWLNRVGVVKTILRSNGGVGARCYKLNAEGFRVACEEISENSSVDYSPDEVMVFISLPPQRTIGESLRELEKSYCNALWVSKIDYKLQAPQVSNHRVQNEPPPKIDDQILILRMQVHETPGVDYPKDTLDRCLEGLEELLVGELCVERVGQFEFSISGTSPTAEDSKRFYKTVSEKLPKTWRRTGGYYGSSNEVGESKFSLSFQVSIEIEGLSSA